MHHRLLLLSIGIPAVFLGGAARADDVGLQRCRAIADPTARLACYDALQVPAEAKVAPPGAPLPRATPEQFGFEEKLIPMPAVDSIESTIPGHFEGWWPNAVFRLANGQVWQVTDGSNRVADSDNPKITIQRGMMGAYYLNLDGENRTVRVKRLQ
jgi:hypothetical protein